MKKLENCNAAAGKQLEKRVTNARGFAQLTGTMKQEVQAKA